MIAGRLADSLKTATCSPGLSPQPRKWAANGSSQRHSVTRSPRDGRPGADSPQRAPRRRPGDPRRARTRAARTGSRRPAPERTPRASRGLPRPRSPAFVRGCRRGDAEGRVRRHNRRRSEIRPPMRVPSPAAVWRSPPPSTPDRPRTATHPRRTRQASARRRPARGAPHATRCAACRRARMPELRRAGPQRIHDRSTAPAGRDHQDRLRPRPPPAHRGRLALPQPTRDRQGPDRPPDRSARRGGRDRLERAAAPVPHLGAARATRQAPHDHRRRRRPRAHRLLLGDRAGAPGGPGAAARGPSCARRPSSSSSPSAARRSPSRSVVARGG